MVTRFTTKVGVIMKSLIIKALKYFLISIAVLSMARSESDVKPEIIGYVLKPSNDVHCQIQIEIVESFNWENESATLQEEILEILMDRIIFEETNYWGVNEIFYVIDKPFILIRLPYTGHWYGKEN
jgi:hypothetical protein|tara:strand:- start:146 stop:523 length:378 start_codon:yes stop_codon:yes gene_type:complete